MKASVYFATCVAMLGTMHVGSSQASQPGAHCKLYGQGTGLLSTDTATFGHILRNYSAEKHTL